MSAPFAVTSNTCATWTCRSGRYAAVMAVTGSRPASGCHRSCSPVRRRWPCSSVSSPARGRAWSHRPPRRPKARSRSCAGCCRMNSPGSATRCWDHQLHRAQPRRHPTRSANPVAVRESCPRPETGGDHLHRPCRPGERTHINPYGIVAHSNRWYVTGADSASGEIRIFRLDRVSALTIRQGTFDLPDEFDPVSTVMSGLARTPWRHQVSVLVHYSAQHVRQHFPAGLATVQQTASPDDDQDAEWLRVQLRAERLDWIPPLLAALDCPLVIEHPAELRDLVRDLAERLARSASATSSAAAAQ